MKIDIRKKLNLLVIVPLLFCMMPGLLNFNRTEKAIDLTTESSTEIKLVTGEFSSTVTNNDSVFDVLDQIKSQYGYKNAQNELVLDKIMPVTFGKIYKLNQTYQGLSVFGRGVNVSVDDNGKVLSVSGNFLSDITLNVRTTLSADETIDIISGNFEDALVLFSELAIYSLEGTSCIAYNIEAALSDGNYRIFVDANSGVVLNKIPLSDSITFGGSSVETTQTDYYGDTKNLYIEKTTGGEYYLADATRNIYMFDNKNYGDNSGGQLQSNNYYKNTTGSFSDSIAVSAFSNIIQSFDFYTDAENIGVSVRGVKDSVDYSRDNADSNKESTIRVYMHYGKNFENAFYMAPSKSTDNYISLVFGDGKQNGTLYNTSLALDVVGHEYQHALTDYISGLVYQNASGALNEAYSDIFGIIIEDLEMGDDNFWLLGEDATPNKKGLRSMKDPKSYGYPDNVNSAQYLNDRPTDRNDYGGVHINNSIITHVQYKMWQALPQHFTKENIGKLWYSALGMLNSNATFEDFRSVLCQAAVQLGWDSSILQVMRSCFASSGIGTAEVYHTVTFKSDGKTLSTQQVLDGSAAVAPSNPAKASTAQYNYIFEGWDAEFDCVESDLVINAVYSFDLRSYTVTWIIEGESETQEYFYGETPIYDGEPAKASDEGYVYSFIGWDTEIESVSGDITYTAQFSNFSHYNTVTFISDGEQIEQFEVVYGGKLTELPNPVKSGYAFVGWYRDEACEIIFDKDLDVVCGDTSLYAKWEQDVDKQDENSGSITGCGTITTGGIGMLIILITCFAGIILYIGVVLYKRKEKTQINT